MIKQNRKTKAFSLIELSIVIVIIGILISGVIQGSNLIYGARLNTARSLSQKSPIIAMEDLILWMDVTQEGVTTNADGLIDVEEGEYIDIWRDVNPQAKSNMAFTAPASTNRPIYREEGINGLPALEFDGLEDLSNGDYLSTPETMATRQPNNHTIFAVFAPIEGNDNPLQGVLVKLDGTRNSPYSVVFHGNSNRVVSLSNSSENNTEFISNNVKQVTKAIIATVTHNSDNITSGFHLYINGGNLDTGDANTSVRPSGDALVIGRQREASATRFCKCFISEIIMFDRVLENSERDLVEEYLGRKWSIVLES